MSETSRAVPDGGTRRRIEGLVAGPAEACQRSQAGSIVGDHRVQVVCQSAAKHARRSVSRGVSGKEGLADPVLRFHFVSQKIRSLKVQERARRLTKRSAVRSLDRSATQPDFKILGKVSIGKRSVPFTRLDRTSLGEGGRPPSRQACTHSTPKDPWPRRSDAFR